MKRLLFILIGAACLAGCNWMRLFEFRAQLRQLPEFAHWEDRAWGRTLVFSEPVLGADDLADLGLAPVSVGEGLFVIRYRYDGDGSHRRGETTLFFLIENGRLRGVTFPALLLEMIGEKNVEALLRITGGDSSPEVGVCDVEKTRVLRAVFGTEAPPADDRKLDIMFEPLDAANRVLKLSFEEGGKPGIYNKLRLVIGKAGESVASVRAR